MSYEYIDENPPSEFDQEFINNYIDKYIIIGVTYFDPDGNEIEKTQMHGIIRAITSQAIEVELQGKRKGELWKIPPAFNFITPAEPGVYTLQTTGETIEDPDFISTWNVTKQS
ncbi:MAG: hypothetical protein HC907_06935 [Richelia sp. SM1_7_0]|nr:hypothetical protein [Richelia sp. SM1_7_0]